MKNKDTAFAKIQKRLLKKGIVDNYWAIDTRLTTRISDAIFKLRCLGWNIETIRGYEMPKWTAKTKKNTYYQLIEK